MYNIVYDILYDINMTDFISVWDADYLRQNQAEAVTDPADGDAVDGNKDEDDTRRTPSASPPPPSKERAKTLELNK